MRKTCLLILTGLSLLPLSVAADLSANDLPPGAVWYLHADLDGMRTSASGEELYRWVDAEVFSEFNEEFGVDVRNEVDRLTAFSDTTEGAVFVIEGAISNDFRDAILDELGDEASIERFDYDGDDFYRVQEDGNASQANGRAGRDDALFFSFAVDGKIVAASDERRLKALLDSEGRISAAKTHEDALFVLTADKQFVQAGMRTAEFADDEDDWDSNILRNTEQVALLVFDQDGLVAVEAKLMSRDPQMTRSIGNIVNGLISLQAFNSDMDPAIAGVLQNTKVTIEDKVLSISTVLQPEAILDVLND